MKKIIEINGQHFEVEKEVKLRRDLSVRELKDVYKKPSLRKCNIFNMWYMWAVSSDIEFFGINSYNTNIFTLKGYKKIDGVVYEIHINPTRKFAYVVDGTLFEY